MESITFFFWTSTLVFIWLFWTVLEIWNFSSIFMWISLYTIHLYYIILSASVLFTFCSLTNHIKTCNTKRSFNIWKRKTTRAVLCFFELILRTWCRKKSICLYLYRLLSFFVLILLRLFCRLTTFEKGQFWFRQSIKEIGTVGTETDRIEK